MSDPEFFLSQRQIQISLPYTLYEHIWRGFLPEEQFIELDLIPDFHASYQSTYVEKDIRQLADIADIGLFGRFVRLVAALTAQEMNYARCLLKIWRNNVLCGCMTPIF